jgi:hypothetical protein
MTPQRALAVALTVALTVALAVARPASADSTGAIEQIVAKDLTPAAGSVATVQIAVSPDDGTVWAAGSYTLSLIATEPNGTPVATAPPFAADEAATPQQTTMVFVSLPLPPDFTGALVVHAHLDHGKSSEDSAPVGIVVGPPAAAPVAAAPTPPAAPPRTPRQSYSGSLALNDGLAAQQSQSAVLNLSGKEANNESITVSAGLANTLGNVKPVVTLQTPSWLAQFGTISPSFDRDAFAGPTGTGVAVKTTWNNAQESLQGAYISGNHDTTNPFEMAAISFGFPVDGSAAEATAGYEDVDGPAQTGSFFLRDGVFAGVGDDVRAPHSSITYGIHYGLTSFHDDLSGLDEFGDVFDLSFGFNIRKAHVALTYDRASPFFANVSAPGVTADRETESAAVTIPLGTLQVSLGATAYRDGLPGSTLLQTTNYATENLGITYPFANGSVLSFQAVNGVQHQTGDPIAPFSGNDGTTFAYTTRRGPYAIQLNLADTETRDDMGDLLHVITNGITISRAPFAGLTVSGGFNMNTNDASSASETTIGNSATGSLSYAGRGWTLSTQVNHSLTHPYLGLSSPPTTTYSYGLTLNPHHSRYSFAANVTENIGAINSSVGALSLNRQF